MGSRGIALRFFGHGTRSGWGVRVTPRPLFTPGKNPVPTVQEGGWAPGPVWICAENFTPIGIGSLDRPARSELLYRLSLPGPRVYTVVSTKFELAYLSLYFCSQTVQYKVKCYLLCRKICETLFIVVVGRRTLPSLGFINCHKLFI